MKILEVTNLFSPVHGGAAEVPYQLSKELSRRGHDVTLYTSDFKLDGEYIATAPDVEIHAFKTRLGLANFHITPGAIGRAGKEVRSFDIVHLHNYRTFQNAVIHRYARKYGVPYVLQAHGSLPRVMGKNMLKQAYDHLWGYGLLRDASRLIAINTIEAEQYHNMGVREDRIEIIPHGVNLTEFASLPERGTFRKKFSLDDNQSVVLYLGRLHKIKGLDLLMKAFAGVIGLLPEVKLVIAGPDDGYLSALKKSVSGLGIEDHVLFTGPLYGRAKLEAYIDCDVYVLPSSYEIFGITILEAWACGKPVVTTNRCGLSDVIDGQAGLVVPHNKDSLQDALLQIVSDDKMKREFGEKGKSLVSERFNWGRIVEQIERLYQSVQDEAFSISV